MSEPRESALPERREPTHTLTIGVPLNLDANPAAESWDIQEAFREAITAILPLISLGTLGLRCGDVMVEVEQERQTDAEYDERDGHA